jgi:uncharacterized protein YkwD
VRRSFLLGLTAAVAAGALGATSVRAASTPTQRLLAPPGTCGAAADIPGLDVASARRAILCLTNYARDRSGLRRLTSSALLDRTGVDRLQANVRCGEFSHTPCGSPFGDAFAPYVARARSFRIGENIAWGVGDDATPRLTMDSWLRSPEHRSNILSPVFRELGVGYLPAVTLQGSSDSALWSQEFGVRSAPR